MLVTLVMLVRRSVPHSLLLSTVALLSFNKAGLIQRLRFLFLPYYKEECCAIWLTFSENIYIAK